LERQAAVALQGPSGEQNALAHKHIRETCAVERRCKSSIPLVIGAQGICDKAAARWDLTRVALAHRTGTCAVGEPSVMIAASSPHRRDALEVKTRVRVRARVRARYRVRVEPRTRTAVPSPGRMPAPVATVLVTYMTPSEQQGADRRTGYRSSTTA